MQDDPMTRAVTTAPNQAAPVARVSNADSTTLALLTEWLQGAGYRVVADDAEHEPTRATVSIVDVPFTRTGAQIIEGVAQRHPGEPIIALSATFLSSVGCGGGCAKRLGVEAVLAKPFSRASLLGALERAAPLPRRP